jgi:hypothetical protein
MPRLISAVARLLRERDADPGPHFHQGSDGADAPAVCFDSHCPYPRLDA